MGESSCGDSFDVTLGEAILAYLDSLPPEDLVRAFLTMHDSRGVEEERFLEAWADSAAERKRLLSAAERLSASGELKRVRVPSSNRGGERKSSKVLWFRGPAHASHDRPNRKSPPYGPPSPRRGERRRTNE